MRALLEFAREEQLGKAYGTLSEVPLGQGIILDIDPFWAALWELHVLGVDESSLAAAVQRRLYDIDDRSVVVAYGRNAPAMLVPPHLRSLLSYAVPVEGPDYDIGWRPAAWSMYADAVRRGTEDPRVVIVSLRPGPAVRVREARSWLLDVTNDFPFHLMTEVRRVASLAASRREAVGGQGIYVRNASGVSRGTLGGVFRDEQTGKRFGLTCGHVATDVGAATYGTKALAPYSLVGFCADSIMPDAVPNGSICNPYGTTLGGDIDVALIQIDPAVTLPGTVRHIGRPAAIVAKTSIAPGQSAELSGGQSQHCPLRIGGLALTYAFRGQGRDYCYRNLFEVKPRTRRWEPPMITSLRGVAASGDSGAWVALAGPAGPEAAGILVGVDGSVGYACFMDSALDWAKSRGHTLALP